MNFTQNEHTGSIVVAPFTPFGQFGPKHYGMILGTSLFDGKTYVSELRYNGYHITAGCDFLKRFFKWKGLRLLPNKGPSSDLDVANKALKDNITNRDKKYNLLSNNCESHTNRATYGTSLSTQVVTGVVIIAVVVAFGWMLKKTKARVA